MKIEQRSHHVGKNRIKESNRYSRCRVRRRAVGDTIKNNHQGAEELEGLRPKSLAATEVTAGTRASAQRSEKY